MNQAASKEEKPARMYFIAVVLPKELDEKVLAHKRWMQEHFGCKVGLKSQAHITIAPPFWMEENKEESLRSDIRIIASATPAFHLQTANFSAFKPRTIFVALSDSEALQALKQSAYKFFRQTAYKMKIENRPFHPHITIATRDLSKKDFAEAWPNFENKEFDEIFDASGLSLLKHNGRNWDVVFTAPFSDEANDEK